MGQPVLSEGQIWGAFLQEVEVNKKKEKKWKRKCITEVKLGSSKIKNKSEVWEINLILKQSQPRRYTDYRAHDENDTVLIFPLFLLFNFKTVVPKIGKVS